LNFSYSYIIYFFQIPQSLALKHCINIGIQYHIMAWEKTAADKKNRIAASIPQEWRIKSVPTGDSVMDFPKNSGILSAEELAITESTATDLVAQMASGKLTSVAVTTAFCKRAALAHQLVGYPGLRS
jgi:hypothetical protein